MWSIRDVRDWMPKRFLHIVNASGNCAEGKATKLEVLCEQLIDSLIVGGIGGFTAYVSAGEAATLNGFFIAFGLTFLMKMKEYRKIK